MKRAGQIVLTPFPYTDLSATKLRDGRVVHADDDNAVSGLIRIQTTLTVEP